MLICLIIISFSDKIILNTENNDLINIYLFVTPIYFYFLIFVFKLKKKIKKDSNLIEL